MIRKNIQATDATLEATSNIQDFELRASSTSAVKRTLDPSRVCVTVSAGTNTLNLSIRPYQLEKELNAKRLNKALELGYAPPRKSTLVR